MSELQTKLAAAMALPDESLHLRDSFSDGAFAENARRRPIDLALAKCVEALEATRHSTHAPGHCKTCDALAELERVIGEGK